MLSISNKESLQFASVSHLGKYCSLFERECLLITNTLMLCGMHGRIPQ